MYRCLIQLSVHVPCKNNTRFFPCVLRDYCNVSKSRKKRVTRIFPSDVPKLADPLTCTNSISTDIYQEQNNTSLCKDSLDSTESSSLADKASRKKKQTKTAPKDCVEKPTKEKKSSKASLSQTEPDETAKPSLSERYGDSINIPGMKPFSTSKRKKKALFEAQPSDKSSEDTQETSTEGVDKSDDAVPTFQDTIDISEVIPKIRSPSFRLEKKLDVPCEWAVMAGSWTPSEEFLNSILKFPIGGLEKSNDVEGKNADYVSCFVTANKNAAKVVPAVTTVLSKTMTPAQAYALKLWRERLTKQLGEEGFQQHKTQILTRGKQFHDTIQRYLHGESVQNLNIDNLPLITGCWKSLIPVLNRIDDVIAVESEVLHPQLLYKGVIDCIVEIRGQPFIVEWKHSSRKKESLQKNYDSPVQLMAYTGAINSNTCYPFGVKNSLLVVAYDDGSPADVFLLSAPENGDHHWHTWLKRLHTYWTLLKVERELGN